VAIENFTNSLCAYSLVCYILQIKDRHNENILIDIEGHVLHIDFGFLLSNAPGKGLKFESAPFKLTQEMLDVMGGENSDKFRDFRTRMARGFCELQANAEKIIILVEMMLMGQSDLPCFVGGRSLIRDLKLRLFPNGRRMNFEDTLRHINDLISQSVNNWRTKCYDRAQYCMQGIL
jgi:phosphatidylinositol kinase/protein kinase (PI-3  family)